MQVFSINGSTASRKFLLAIAASAVITTVLSWLLYLLGSRFLSDPKSLLTDQSLASYIGVIFATAVALGGSLVAIVLADRAVTSANEQVELARQANQISEHQSPDGVAAVAAAGHYERLKGLLITMPALLRKAHRDHLFDEAPSAQGSVVLGELLDLITQATRVFLESTVPAMVVSLAARVNGSITPRAVQHQRYFEFAISSLYYDLAAARQMLLSAPDPAPASPSIRDVLLRILHGIYTLMREMDTLIVACEQKSNEQPDIFSALERKFIAQVLPVVRLNRDLWLTSDFDSLENRILRSIMGSLPIALAPMNAVTMTGEARGGPIFTLHEGGHSKALTQITRIIRADGATGKVIHVDDGNWERAMPPSGAGAVPIFLISEQHVTRLAQLHAYSQRMAGAAWDQCVVVFDQVDQVPAATPYIHRLSLSDAIHCWKRFLAVQMILDKASGILLPFQDRDISHLRAVIRDLLKNVPDKQFPTGQQMQDLLGMMSGAAQDATGEKPDNSTLFGWVSLCDGLLRDMLDDHGDEVQLQRLKIIDLSDEMLLSTVDKLAMPPLLARPLYHLAAGSVPHVAGNEIDLFLDNAAYFGVAYLDTRFGVGTSPLLELLAESGKGHLLL